MKTLTLESCNNKLNKKPWLAKLALEENELKYKFVKYDECERISGTRNRYEWDLEENVLYAKGDTENYSNYVITMFIIENGKEVTFDKRTAKKILKAGSYENYKNAPEEIEVEEPKNASSNYTKRSESKSSFQQWYDEADMPEKVNGHWVDLETGIGYK